MLPMVWYSLSVPELGLPRHGKIAHGHGKCPPEHCKSICVHSKCHSGYNTSLHAHGICIPTCQGKCPPWYGKSIHDHGQCPECHRKSIHGHGTCPHDMLKVSPRHGNRHPCYGLSGRTESIQRHITIVHGHGKCPPEHGKSICVHSKCHSGYNTSLHAHRMCILIGDATILICQCTYPPWYGISIRDHGNVPYAMVKVFMDMLTVHRTC
jgi:hypothetical protein